MLSSFSALRGVRGLAIALLLVAAAAPLALAESVGRATFYGQDGGSTIHQG